MTTENAAWLDAPEPGWSPVELPYPATAANFVSSEDDDRRLAVRYYRRDADGALMLKTLFGPDTQGPPGHAHGGSMAALLDEAMGGAAWLAGHPVVAAEITISFKRMLPLLSACVVEAKVTSVEGRKVRAEGALRSRDGETLYCTSRALLIELDESQLGELSARVLEMLRTARDETGEDQDTGL